MPNDQNKVFFGLAEAHWAPVTEVTDPETGVVSSTYGSYSAIPGLVSISQDPQGTKTVFRADDSDYFSVNPNGGYSGNVKFARLPDDLREYCFGEKRDDNGVLVESANDAPETKYFVFAFRFKGDKKAIRHEFLKCSITRPSITGETTPEGDTPNISGEEVTLTSVPRVDADQYVHLVADPKTQTATWNAWYNAVYIPTFTNAADDTDDTDDTDDNN